MGYRLFTVLFSLMCSWINDFSFFHSYEIRDVRLPPKVQEAMQMQVEAEVDFNRIDVR